MRLIFVVVAAGSGKRFGFKKNKLLYEIDSKPLIYFTLETIQKCNVVNEVILVSKEEEIHLFNEIVKRYNFTKIKAIIPGGKERQDSVYNALLWLNENYSNKEFFVGIHDGARINVTTDLIKRIYETALKYNSAVPVIFAKDTVKKITKDKFIKETLPREEIALVQTPQIFKFSLIFNAYQNAYKNNFYTTDDAGLVEYYGKKIKIVEGTPENIKITYMKDLDLLSNNKREFRIGTGFDIHKLVKGRKLFLGGIEIPYNKGFLAHSDGDVLIHSIIDALLGATGMDDIGMLFPDYDEKFKDIRSTELLKEVISLIAKKDCKIVNIDSVIIGDEPKISEYKEKIRKKLSKLIGIEKERINLKGKRTEGVLFENAIASYTIVLVKF